MSVNIQVLDDPADAVADLLVQAAREGGHIVITGGSSPQRAYELAAARAGDAWGGATVWFSDDRCVPPGHELSNYGMAEASLLERLDPRPEVMRMQGELGPEAGADAYARDIRERLGEDPHWDLMLLGLGPDAHIASLFPGRSEKHVTDRSVVAVPEAGMEPYVPRISLTVPALNAAGRVVFLVTGADKAPAVQRAFGDTPDPESPAAHVRPVTVFLDPAAAGR